MGSASLCPTWAAVVCGMCNWPGSLGTDSLQLSDTWEKITSGSHTGWQIEGLNSTKERCCLHMVEPL